MMPMRIMSMFCLLAFAVACSLPSLESVECSQARESVRKFYSFHLGNDTAFNSETLELRKHYLTRSFFELLSRSGSGGDPFTLSDVAPRTFKIAECRSVDASTAEIRIQVYWKDDDSTVQKDFHVTTKLQDGNWLIDRIY